ncbi:metallophosphoesterase [Pseudenhygromyxa sp. WMMC2535]|uniref:metallophosphoesterase n=1 Tax=Pseudenhygromyxa sp. WMMC2535 TaxID=2712867 RepID=UPI001551BDF4|nr:metallophosphoesterase [Pseudenhygromyxa sp. WMMC2535]NVB36767.1 metallophosphoesterase [Pseudenhygromyxa sp. WMMC2535]
MRRVLASSTPLLLAVIAALGCGPRGTSETRARPLDDAEASDKAPRPPRAARFVSLSDLHFDPFIDPALVPKLAAAEPEQWRELFEAAAPDAAPSNAERGQDTSFALLDSSLRALADQLGSPAAGEPAPEFVVISGDFLAHHFRRKFDAAMATQQDDARDEAAYRRFVDKTLAFVTAELRAATGELPIFPALGNNDSYCGDYALAASGDFLRMAAATWAPQVSPETGEESEDLREAFTETFAVGGYYQLPSPSDPEHRLIVLNTTFWSANYDRDACGEPSPDESPSELQFEWLSTALAEAREAGEHVWLIYHIPPGINVYPAAHPEHDDDQKPGCGDGAALFWRAGAEAAFLHMLDDYGETITASLAGHIHTDDFRLRTISGAATELVHITPAISPMFGNNPSYQVIDFEATEATLEDYSTRYLDLSAEQPRWAEEYRFSATYDLPRYDLDGVEALRRRLRDEPETRATFERLYPASAPDAGQLDASNWPAYWCGMQIQSPEGFERCACALEAGPQPSQPSEPSEN